jgi:transposase
LEALIPGRVGVVPAPRKYPAELRERAVRLVFEIRQETGQKVGAISRVADKLGVSP